MDYTSTILAVNSHTSFELLDDDAIVEIDEQSRHVTIPEEGQSFNKTIALQYDCNSNSIKFRCARYIDGHDLLQCANAFISWEQGISHGTYTIVDREAEEGGVDNIVFNWIIGPELTTVPGSITFQIVFIDLNQEQNTLIYRWATAPCVGQFHIGESLFNPQIDAIEGETNPMFINEEELQQLLQEVFNK